MRPLTTLGALDQHDGENVVVRGTYWVQDLGPYTLKVPDGAGGYRSVKRIAHVRVDGGDVELGDRPAEEMETLDGQLVEACGRLYLPAPLEDEEVASSEPLPTLMDITSVEAVADR